MKVLNPRAGLPTSLITRVEILENNEYKITYYEVVTGTSGSLTVPTGATIQEDEFGISDNAILSGVTGSGRPDWTTPLTAGELSVTVDLTVVTGAWITSGIYVNASVAIVYVVTIKGIDFANLTENNVIEYALLDHFQATQTVLGLAEIATQGETDTGTDDLRIVTPKKLKDLRGIESFFTNARGNFGTGAGWADSGFINLIPVLLYASNATERAIFMFFGLNRIQFDLVDPQVGFVVYSTGAPSASEAVRWQLTVRYRAEGEDTAGAADEVLLQTQELTTLSSNTRQATLFFTLDRSLISNEDIIHCNLERLGGDGADDYGSDIGVGQSGTIVQVNPFNP